MNSRRIRYILMAAISIPVLVFGQTSVAEAYTTNDVLGGSYLIPPQISVSTTGRYVAFIASQSTLVSPDLNNRSDAFIKDTETGVVKMLSVTPDGNSGNGHTNDGVIITGNGRYALFNSEATNLSVTPGYHGGVKNLYFRDIKNSVTYLIAKGYNSVRNYPIGMSEDGRFLYYTSDQNGNQLFVFDRLKNTAERVDVNSSGVPGNNSYQGTSSTSQKMVSCDGRFIVLSSSSTNLVDDDTNGYSDIFVIDRMGGNFIKNLTINANGHSTSPKITCDGNFIIFYSKASNLVGSDTNNSADIFRYSVADDLIERVSVKDDESEYAGVATNDGEPMSVGYDISMDGRYVFYVRYRELSVYDKRNFLDMRDTKLGTTSEVSPSGSNYHPLNPIVSYDGRKLYYVFKNSAIEQIYSLRSSTNYLP